MKFEQKKEKQRKEKKKKKKILKASNLYRTF